MGDMQTDPVGQDKPAWLCLSHGWPAVAERACRQLPAPPLVACTLRVTNVLALQSSTQAVTLQVYVDTVHCCMLKHFDTAKQHGL